MFQVFCGSENSFGTLEELWELMNRTIILLWG